MKKLLILLVSAALLVSLAAVSMAAPSVSGELKAKYEFESSSSYDKLETDITVAGKISDPVAGSVTWKADSDESNTSIVLDCYTITGTYDWGTFTLGKWGYNPKGKVDVIDPLYGDFKAEAATAFDKKFENGVNIGLWYSPCASNADGEGFGDNAFIGTVGYSNDQFSAGAYIIDKGENLSDYDGFSLTFAYTGLENWAFYANYEDNDIKDGTSEIIGAKFSLDNFFVDAETNLNNDWKKDYYGVKFHYGFTNGIYGEYKYVNTDDDTTTSELVIGAKF